MVSSLFMAKVASIMIFVISSTFGILLSVRLSKSTRLTTIMALCNATAAGALFSLWLFHLLPEFIELVENEAYSMKLRITQVEYLFTFVGFCSMLLSTSISHDSCDKLSVKRQCAVTSQLETEIKQSAILPSKCLECSEVSLEEYQCHKNSLKDNSEIATPSHSLSFECTPRPLETAKCPLFVFLHPFVKLRRLPWSTMFFGIAFVVHGFFEGFVVGSNSNVSGVLLITTAMMLHKWIESVAIVLGRGESASEMNLTIWIVLIIAALSSPFGIVMGAVMTYFPLLWYRLFSAFTFGIMLYAVAHFTEEAFLRNDTNLLYRFAAFLSGAAIVYVAILSGLMFVGN